MADKIVLTAELVNKISENLKDINRQVRAQNTEISNMRRVSAQGYLVAAKQTTEHTKKLTEGSKILGREMKALGEGIGKLSPEFGNLADSVLTFGRGAGAAIGVVTAFGAATVAAALKLDQFGKSMQSLKFASAQSGFTPGQMRVWEQAGARFNVSAEEMQQGAVAFGWSLTKIRTNYEEFGNQLRQSGFGRITDTLHDRMMKNANDVTGAWEDVFKEVDRIKKEFPGAAGEQRVSELFRRLGLPENLARASTKQWAEVLASVKAINADMKVTDDYIGSVAEQSVKFHQDMAETRQIFGNFGDIVAHDITPAFDQLVVDFNDLFKSNAQVWAKGFSDTIKTDLQDLKGIITGLTWIEQHTPEWIKVLLGGPIGLATWGGPAGEMMDVPGVGLVPSTVPGSTFGQASPQNLGAQQWGRRFGGPSAGPGGVPFTGPQGGGARGGEPYSVPAGTPAFGAQERITLSNGVSLNVNKQFAPQVRGFMEDLIKMGAPITAAGGQGTRPNPSAHPGGYAFDVNQVGRNVMSPAFSQWYAEHTAQVASEAAKWGMIEGRTFRSPDAGHFSARRIFSPEEIDALLHPPGSQAVVPPVPYADVTAARNALDALNAQKLSGKGTVDINVDGAAKPSGARTSLLIRRLQTRHRQNEPAATGPQEASAAIPN
jgi:hypothetical protein